MTSTTERFRFPAGAAALVFLAVLVVGCSTNSPIAEGPAASAEPPLEVWLTHPGSTPGPWAAFHVNRPAFVAVFDIRPGVGVTALYPYDHRMSTQRRFHRGINTVLRRGDTPALNHPFNGCLAAMHSPVVFRVAVASERPLQLDRVRQVVSFNHRPALRSLHFAGGTAFSTMDELLYRILPAGAGPDPMHGVDWAVDYVPYWLDTSCAPRAPVLAFCPVQQLASGLERTRARSAPAAPEDGKLPAVAVYPDLPLGESGSRGKPPIIDEGRETSSVRPVAGEDVAFPAGAWTPEARGTARALADEAGGDRGPERDRRARLADQATERFRYLPNARLPDRTFQDGAPFQDASRFQNGRRVQDRGRFQDRRRTSVSGPEIRLPGSAGHATPRASTPRARPAPAKRPAPKVRPAPSPKSSSGSGAKDKNAQK